jgi:WD40 repeat protein
MSLKDPILTVFQTQKISILLKLKDDRLIIYSEDDRAIKLYNYNFSLSYIIKKIYSLIRSMIQTSNESLICASYEINVIHLKKNDYEIIQTIKIGTDKIIELSDNNIIALQSGNISFYSLLNDKYILKEKHKFEENVDNIIPTKDNDACLLLDNYSKQLSINIYDIGSKEIVLKLYEIKNKESGEMCVIQNKYLVVSLYLYLILIDIDDYNIIHQIKTTFGSVVTFCPWNDYTFFSGDDIGDIYEWKINNNKIIKVKEYNNGKKTIKSIIKINDNVIAAGSYDKFIKFYKL